TALCRDSITYCLVVEPEFTFFIPNGFTPNGDGMNDTFGPKGEHIDEYTMRIYDRWGNLVFHTADFSKQWNGTMNKSNEVVLEDVYVYIIDVKDRLGQRHQYIGHITIIK
ncbi:MAG: gliding motility-associated C-terminal domain-containing protein, partial [Bacteroidota bacterium]|nr:gliding motility-associated C-terminal domain-containing protein [Bacteroidota bacterium]